MYSFLKKKSMYLYRYRKDVDNVFGTLLNARIYKLFYRRNRYEIPVELSKYL